MPEFRILVSARFAFSHLHVVPLALALALALQCWAWAITVCAQVPGELVLLDAQLPGRLQRCVSAERLQASYELLQRREPAEARSVAPELDVLRVELRPVGQPQSDTTEVELRAFRGARPLGVRVLPIRTRDCAALPDTLALVLQLLSRSEAPELAAPAPEPPPTAQPIAAEAVAEPEHPRLRPSTEAQWAVGLTVGAFWGALPRTAAALQLLAALRLPAVELRLRATVLWPQERAIAEGSVQMSTYELAAEACQAAVFDPWALRVCVGPRAGVVRAASRGFAVRNRDLAEFSLYLGVLPEVAFALSGTTWLQLSAGIALALQRPKFVLQFQAPSPELVLDGPEVLRAEIGLGVLQIF